jgi:hypothetical protein
MISNYIRIIANVSIQSLPHERIGLLPIHPRAWLGTRRLCQELSARTDSQAKIHGVEVVNFALRSVVFLHSRVWVWSAGRRPEELLSELVILLLAVGVVVQDAHASTTVTALRTVVALCPVCALRCEAVGRAIAKAVVERVAVPFCLSCLVFIEVLFSAGVARPRGWLRLREGRILSCHVLLDKAALAVIAVWVGGYSSRLVLKGFFGFSCGAGGNFSMDFCFSG